MSKISAWKDLSEDQSWKWFHLKCYNIHHILDDKLYRVQSALEKELASIALVDIKQDTEKYLSEESR